MSSVKPSRRIFFLIIACIIGVSAIGFAVYASNMKSQGIKNAISASNGNSQTAQIIQQTLKNNAAVDTDKDDLQNWEEILWGTDNNNPDTDKDGTNDGAEVKANRNPNKAGPDDELTNIDSTVKSKAALEVEADKTTTGAISRELFSHYLEVKRSGVALDARTQNEIIEETFLNKNLIPSYRKYSASDVKIAAESDLKQYGEALGFAFYAGATDSTVSEMDIVLEALSKNKAEDLKKLDPIIKGYEATLDSLTQIYVPKELVDRHTEILDSVSRIVADITGLKQIIADPLAGLGSVGAYNSDTELLRQALMGVRMLLDQNKITYENTEYGHVFMRIAQ